MRDNIANVPIAVGVTFPRFNAGPLDSMPHFVTVTLASLALDEYEDLVGHDGVHLIRSTAIANFPEGGGSVQLTALATQIATDFYLWRLAPLEVRYRTVVPWESDGMHDIEWSHGDGIMTAVMRSVWSPDCGELKHAGEAGSSDNVACLCVQTCSGETKYARLPVTWVSNTPCDSEPEIPDPDPPEDPPTDPVITDPCCDDVPGTLKVCLTPGESDTGVTIVDGDPVLIEAYYDLTAGGWRLSYESPTWSIRGTLICLGSTGSIPGFSGSGVHFGFYGSLTTLTGSGIGSIAFHPGTWINQEETEDVVCDPFNVNLSLYFGGLHMEFSEDGAGCATVSADWVDTFTDTDAVYLIDHTPDLPVDGVYFNGTGTLGILTNRLIPYVTGSSSRYCNPGHVEHTASFVFNTRANEANHVSTLNHWGIVVRAGSFPGSFIYNGFLCAVSRSTAIGPVTTWAFYISKYETGTASVVATGTVSLSFETDYELIITNEAGLITAEVYDPSGPTLIDSIDWATTDYATNTEVGIALIQDFTNPPKSPSVDSFEVTEIP